MYEGPPGRPHWEVREDASWTVLVALFVRDALGITDPSGLPKLLGTGLGDVPAATPDLALGWLRWWIPLVEPDARGWELGDGGDSFSRAVRAHLDDARAWATVAHEQYNGSSIARMQRPDWTLNELITDRSTALGREAHPFRLRIEVLPLTESGVWWIGDEAIAVDETTRNEPILYRDVLAPVIAQIV